MAPKVRSWTSIPFVFLRVSCSTSVPSASLPNDSRLKPGRLDDGLFWLDQAPAIAWARTTPAISINVDDNPGICIAGGSVSEPGHRAADQRGAVGPAGSDTSNR